MPECNSLQRTGGFQVFILSGMRRTLLLQELKRSLLRPRRGLPYETTLIYSPVSCINTPVCDIAIKRTRHQCCQWQSRIAPTSDRHRSREQQRGTSAAL